MDQSATTAPLLTKRKRSSDSQMSTSSAQPPLSAVAARRAAREAAQASTAPPTPPSRAPSAKSEPSSSTSPPPPRKSAVSTRSVSKATSEPRQQKDKGKGKVPAPRYFAPPEQREDDVMLLDVETTADEGNGSDDGELSAPEGLDEGEEEALQSSRVELERDEEQVTSNKRRRREKSGFFDPFCVSAFQVVNGVSAVRTTVMDVDGVERAAVVYALQEGESLIIHGTFRLAAVFGSVTSSGSTLPAAPVDEDAITLPALTSSASHPFFSPASHPLAPIYAVPRTSYDDEDDTPSLLLADGTEMDLSRFAAAIVVTDFETGVEGVERALTVGAMGCASGMWPRRAAASLANGKTWSLVTEPTPSLTSVRSLPQWDAALSAALPQLSEGSTDPGRFVALVEGPKRVGKSTMARTLLNALLDRYEAVAYLDTDLGQPEFTPAGFLSLHVLRRPLFGPSFTHLALPLSSHYLGSPSPASDPSAYLAAAQALLETYALEVEYPLLDEPASNFNSRRRGRFARAQQERAKEDEAGRTKIRERVPLVVNTQGWIKGLGADLLAQLKAASQPTHVFSFSAPVGEESSPFTDGYAFEPEVPQPPYHLLQLPPAPPSPLESKWSAADYRILGLASYFHATFPSPSSPVAPSLITSWDFRRSLVSLPPYPFSWTTEDAQLQAVHLIGPGAADGEVKYEHALHALNGAVVAVVAASSAPPRSDSPFPYDPKASSPAPNSSRSLGLALVHSVSPSTSTLYLLTPIPSSLLAAAAPVTLVKGALELPTGLMLDYSVGVTESERESGVAGVTWEGGVPFLSREDEAGAVGGRKKVRRNLMRRGQA